MAYQDRSNSMSWVNAGNVWRSEGSWAGILITNSGNTWSSQTAYCSKLVLYYAKTRADAIWPFKGSNGRMSGDSEFNWGDYSKQKWHWDGPETYTAQNLNLGWSPTPVCPAAALQNRTMNNIQMTNRGDHRSMRIWITFWLYFMRDGNIQNSTCRVVDGWVPAPSGDGNGIVGGGISTGAWWGGNDIAGSGKTANFSFSHTGWTANAKSVVFKLYKGNTYVGERSCTTASNGWSSSITFRATANTTYYIRCYVNGRQVNSWSRTFREPPPYPPTGLWANNTSADNVTTSIYKYSSCSFGIDETGYLPCTFRVQCFTRDRVSGNVIKRGDITGWNIGKYDDGYSSSHSCNFNLNLNENVDVYYQVDVWNNLGRRSVTTGTRRLHRIYTEPSNPSNASVTPNRLMQLYDGNQVNYTFVATLNKWGDRPTPCKVYVRQFKNSSQIKDVYTREDSRSGEVTYGFSTKTDKSYFGNVLRFNLVKYRDPTWTNSVYSNYVNFYETKAVTSAKASLNRTIYTTGKTGEMTYEYSYTKNSSGAFRLYYQVIRMSTAEIMQEVNLVNRTSEGVAKNLKATVRPFVGKGFEGETYVIRIYSEVTELFDNKTTTLLYTIPIQFFDPPIAQLYQKPSKPLNTEIINFNSNIEYTSDVWYTGKVNKVELVYRLAEVETGYRERRVDITSGKFNYIVPTELVRGSECTAYLHIEYDLGGLPEILDTQKIKLTVTPTRYLFFRTENVSSEYKHNKLHFRTSSGPERTSYKIFLD